jgi:hypothetical protein
MPKMDVLIHCSIKDGEENRIERTVDVSQDNLEQLIPPSPAGGGGGWPYWREAEQLVCSIIKEELFPDEVTPIQDLNDLRRLGVTAMHYSFDHEVRGNMGSRAIYPES